MSKAAAVKWLDRVERGQGPLYLALLRALEVAVAEGELQPGDQLPPQRAVAALLGVDFTTVTRAYSAARERGLLEGAVGRGTFVRARAGDDDAGLVDLSMNLPPPPEGVSLAGLLRDTTAAVLQRTDPATLLSYHAEAGTLGQKTAGAAWIAPCLGDVAPERMLVASGAQTALAAVMGTVCKPGDVVVAEALTYPGFKAAATQLGLRVVACDSDGEGLLPGALERLCREASPAALYLVPTLQNPTAVTLSPTRRSEIARVVQAAGLWVIEDDPYGRLLDSPPPAITSLAPDCGFYIATLSKCLSPGLRIAFVVCPDAVMAERVLGALRALSLMPAPLMAAVVNSWIREGVADTLLGAVRTEARARRRIAAEALPAALGAAEGIHVWQPLHGGISHEALRRAAQDRGLSLVTADAFAVGPDHPSGMRISLGGPAKRSVLAEALARIASLLDGAPARGRLVV